MAYVYILYHFMSFLRYWVNLKILEDILFVFINNYKNVTFLIYLYF